MEFAVSNQDALGAELDHLIVPFTSGSEDSEEFKQLDGRLGGLLSSLRDKKRFSLEEGKKTQLHTMGKIAPAELTVIGLGSTQEQDSKRVLEVFGPLAASLASRTGRVGVMIQPGFKHVREVTAAFVQADYVLARYKQEPPEVKVTGITLFCGENDRTRVEEGIRLGRVFGDARNLTRKLADTPANLMTPSILADIVSEMAGNENMKVTVFDEATLIEMGAGAILGVSQGSAEEARMVVLDYTPEKYEKTIAFVGKAITFDSGGISLKPGAKMDEMKFDKCGGSAVAGGMLGVARLRPSTRVIGIIPSSENLPGGKAYKPGDILTSLSGKTIEVLNTDAEGRLILADALHHARSFEPDYIIDLATLTGACMIALGSEFAGMFSNNDEFQSIVSGAASAAGDPVWPMPVNKAYRKHMDTNIADIKNLGKREGGASSAAAFLQEFVGDVPWVHLDIAGTAWKAEGEEGRYVATATGVGTLIELALALSA